MDLTTSERRTKMKDEMLTRRFSGKVTWHGLIIAFISLILGAEADITLSEGIRMTSLNMSVDTDEVVLGENHNITVDLSVYHVHGDITGHVVRNYRWAVEMWMSQHPEGEGEKIQRIKQILSSTQQRQSLITDQHLTFTDLTYQLNLWSTPCSKIQYLCSSFKVRRRGSEVGQITDCQEAPTCKDGIVVRDISFDYRPENDNYLVISNGSTQNLLLNVRVNYDKRVTGNITGGAPMWQLLAWTSTNIDGKGTRHSLKRHILRPRQSRRGLIVGQNLTFDRVGYPLNPSNLSCQQLLYICVRFKMAVGQNYVILSRPNSSVRTECQPGLFCLPSSIFKEAPEDLKNNRTTTDSLAATISGTYARLPPPITMKIPAGFFTSGPLNESPMPEPTWTPAADPYVSDAPNIRLGHSMTETTTTSPNPVAILTSLETHYSESPGQPPPSAIQPLFTQETTESLVTQRTYNYRSERILTGSFSTQPMTSKKTDDVTTPYTTKNKLLELLQQLAEVTRRREDIPSNDIDDVIFILQKLSLIDEIPIEIAKEVVLHTNDFMAANSLRSPNVSSVHNTSQISEHLNSVIDNIRLENGDSFHLNSLDIKVSTSDVTPEGDRLRSFGQIYPVKSDESVQSTQPINIDSYKHLQENVEAGFYIPKTALPLPKSDVESVRVNFIVYTDSRLFDGAGGILITSHASEDDECFICSQVSSLEVRINGERVTSLKQPASLAFNTSQAPSMFSRQCVWWDFGANGGYGDWSTEGCHVAMETEDNIICDCDHLTNFAVFMIRELTGGNLCWTERGRTVHNDSPDYGCKAFELDLISKVGCALSVVALLFTLLTYLKFKKLMPTTAQLVFIQWIFALLCLYTIFLFGIDAVKNALTCSIVSVSLHFFTLSYICWTSVEAVHMYIVLVQVMNGLPRARKFIPWSSAFAWGAPLCVVVGSYLAYGKELYSNREYCFLRRNFNFYVVLLGPIAAILFFNVLCFLVIMYHINFRRPKGTMMQKNRAKLDAVTLKVKQATTVAILVGATWVLGFFAIKDGGYLFALLFCICNSLSGVFVFFVFCLFRKEVRGKWGQTLLCSCCFTDRDTFGRLEFSDKYSRPSSTVKSHSITLEFMPRTMVLELNSPTVSEILESPLTDKSDLF